MEQSALPDPLGQAVGWLRDGGLVAYPTETVWGLAADATQPDAVARLRRWKGRGDDAPLSILVDSLDSLDGLGFDLSELALRVAGQLWPGPLTLVLPCGGDFAPGIARDDGAVGVRCSSHPLCEALARRLRRAGVGPITATSLNHTGEAPAQSHEQAAALCDDGDDAPRLLDVERAEAGGDEASTVVDFSGPEPRVLRWGAVAPRELDPLLERSEA